MNAKIVTESVGWLLGASALLAGCADRPRLAEDAEPTPVIAEDKEPCRGGSCVGRPAAPEDSHAAQGDDDEGEEENGETQPAEPESIEDADIEPEEDQPRTTFDASTDAETGAHAPGDASAGSDASDVDSDAPTGAANDAPPIVLDGGTAGSLDDASSPPKACAPDHCEHGGTCSSSAEHDSCLCPPGYVGQRCEHKVCGDTTIRSPADLDASRDCSEIRGDLTIAAVGLAAIDASDWPALTKVTGDLIISGQQATDRPALESVTLRNLREVEGALMVVGAAVIEFGGSGPLRELHLPALERIGAHDALGLALFQASLTTLGLPALKTVEGAVLLDTLFELCSIDVSNVESVGGDLTVRYVPKLSAAALEPLRSAAAGEVIEQQLGCCEPDGGDRVSCEALTENARGLYCGACEAPMPR